MGRPIKKIFIGERGAGSAGGEGVASVTVDTAGSGYTGLEGQALVISAPDIEGGIQAAGVINVSAGDTVTGTTITEAGSGYTSAPTVTSAGAGTDATFTAVLTSTGAAVINCTAFVTATDLSGDIIAQKGNTTYKVTTSEGTLDCTLVNAAPAAIGEMAIIATDSASGTYYVTKLYNNTVRLDPTNGTGVEFAAGTKVVWADVAVLDYSVKITS